MTAGQLAVTGPTGGLRPGQAAERPIAATLIRLVRPARSFLTPRVLETVDGDHQSSESVGERLTHALILCGTGLSCTPVLRTKGRSASDQLGVVRN
jgi:hypothetical protein